SGSCPSHQVCTALSCTGCFGATPGGTLNSQLTNYQSRNLAVHWWLSGVTMGGCRDSTGQNQTFSSSVGAK
ncbi:hypothetical protein HOY82DRAFT_489716, partial [Tuber indicum]